MSTFSEYLNIDAINWSSLKAMQVSALAYHYFKNNPAPDKPAYALGRATHTAILEPDLFDSQYAIFDGRRAGKKWEEFKAAHFDRDIIKPAEYDLVQRMAEAVHAHPVAHVHLLGGVAEQTMVWKDPPTGLKCKGRADYITDRIVDLKTARAVDPWNFNGAIGKYLYHGQLAFYHHGAWAADYKIDMAPLIIAVQSSAPHDVAVYSLPPEVMQAGADLFRSLLDRLSDCLRTNEWPGCAPDSVLDVSLPSWAAGMESEQDAAELTIGGEEAF